MPLALAGKPVHRSGSPLWRGLSSQHSLCRGTQHSSLATPTILSVRDRKSFRSTESDRRGLTKKYWINLSIFTDPIKFKYE
ncbi:MAG: hypothetical protein V7L27_12760 [Nostoc sp.]